MNEEKDIFDLLRESSEKLEEKPSAKAWEKLENRLSAKRKIKRPRRTPQLQLLAISVALTLLLSIGVASLYITKQNEDVLTAQKHFAALHFLEGEWVFSDGKTHDTWFCKSVSPLHMMGEKKVYFGNTLLSMTSFSLKNQLKNNIFTFNGEPYLLDLVKNDTYSFQSKKGRKIRLRRSAEHRFTLSFDEGLVFLFKKNMP